MKSLGSRNPFGLFLGLLPNGTPGGAGKYMILFYRKYPKSPKATSKSVNYIEFSILAKKATTKLKL